MNVDVGGGATVEQTDERQPHDNQPHNKRIKLEAAPNSPFTNNTDTKATSDSPTAILHLNHAPTSAHDVEAALHGIDDASSGLVHNTVAGELLEHQRVEQHYQPHSMDDAEFAFQADPIDTEQQPDTALHSSPASISSSLAASPPPQPLMPQSPPPLGKYQCDNCSALLTYSSLNEIYHCPLCYHTFTLYPPLAPSTSPPLFPLDFTPTPPAVPALTQWTAADLYTYLHNVPGLSSVAAKSAAAGLDGRYFMAMHVSDMVEEFGLWGSGGAGGSVEGNAALVVQLLNAQRVLRGESVRSVAEEAELVAQLTAMQTVTPASRQQQPNKSAKKARERDKSDKPKKEQNDTAVDDTADADSTVTPSSAETVTARPVKRKKYRIPTAPLPLGSPVQTATATHFMATEATVLSIDDEPPTVQQSVVAATSDGDGMPNETQQRAPMLSNDSIVDAMLAHVAAAQLQSGVAAIAQSIATTTTSGSAIDVAAPPTG